MGGTFPRFFSGCVAPLVLAVCGSAQAVVITYQATDLADIEVGKDRWQYTYNVSGSFVAGGGFNVLFSPALYTQLEPPSAQVIGDWTVATLQPDPDPVVQAVKVSLPSEQSALAADRMQERSATLALRSQVTIPAASVIERN